MKLSAHLKRTLSSRKLEKVSIHKKLVQENRKLGFQKGKFLQIKRQLKGGIHSIHVKGKNAYGVRNSVLICYRLWWEEGRKRLFIKVARACHRRKAICCDKKMGNNKEIRVKEICLSETKMQMYETKNKRLRKYNPRMMSR